MVLTMSMSVCSPPLPTTLPTLSSEAHLSLRTQTLTVLPKRSPSLFVARSVDNGAGVVVEEKIEIPPPNPVPQEKASEKKPPSLGSNGVTAAGEGLGEVLKFHDPRWVGGTWDLFQFKKGGSTDWDAVIDAEVRRRKWLQDHPETTSNDDPVIFDTSIIPWWSWVKRFHLPEAEKLNGRAAMIGFFMAYFVDSLTGVGLVDQMGNFFCKTLLLIAVLGVLFIRNNEDIESLKKLIEETTFYDKQWQATWQEDSTGDSRKE